MKIDFTDQVAVVTGATRGIGARIAADLESLGARLVLTGTDPGQVAALNEAAAAVGRRVQYYAVDFRAAESVAAFIEALHAEPRVDVCINNAGINRINSIGATSWSDWEDVRAVNLDAPLRLVHAVAPGMAARGYGRIVTISSIFGVVSRPGRALYSMTKFGVRGLTTAVALELARSGVLVNTVSPGFVETELTARSLSPAEAESLAAQVPMGRFAAPEEISRAVLFLVSRLNTYITAHNLIVDGGYVNA